MRAGQTFPQRVQCRYIAPRSAGTPLTVACVSLDERWQHAYPELVPISLSDFVAQGIGTHSPNGEPLYAPDVPHAEARAEKKVNHQLGVR